MSQPVGSSSAAIRAGKLHHNLCRQLEMLWRQHAIPPLARRDYLGGTLEPLMAATRNNTVALKAAIDAIRADHGDVARPASAPLGQLSVPDLHNTSAQSQPAAAASHTGIGAKVATMRQTPRGQGADYSAPASQQTSPAPSRPTSAQPGHRAAVAAGFRGVERLSEVASDSTVGARPKTAANAPVRETKRLSFDTADGQAARTAAWPSPDSNGARRSKTAKTLQAAAEAAATIEAAAITSPYVLPDEVEPASRVVKYQYPPELGAPTQKAKVETNSSLATVQDAISDRARAAQAETVYQRLCTSANVPLAVLAAETKAREALVLAMMQSFQTLMFAECKSSLAVCEYEDRGPSPDPEPEPEIAAAAAPFWQQEADNHVPLEPVDDPRLFPLDPQERFHALRREWGDDVYMEKLTRIVLTEERFRYVIMDEEAAFRDATATLERIGDIEAGKRQAVVDSELEERVQLTHGMAPAMPLAAERLFMSYLVLNAKEGRDEARAFAEIRIDFVTRMNRLDSIYPTRLDEALKRLELADAEEEAFRSLLEVHAPAVATPLSVQEEEEAQREVITAAEAEIRTATVQARDVVHDAVDDAVACALQDRKATVIQRCFRDHRSRASRKDVAAQRSHIASLEALEVEREAAVEKMQRAERRRQARHTALARQKPASDTSAAEQEYASKMIAGFYRARSPARRIDRTSAGRTTPATEQIALEEERDVAGSMIGKAWRSTRNAKAIHRAKVGEREERRHALEAEADRVEEEFEERWVQDMEELEQLREEKKSPPRQPRERPTFADEA